MAKGIIHFPYIYHSHTLKAEYAFSISTGVDAIAQVMFTRNCKRSVLEKKHVPKSNDRTSMIETMGARRFSLYLHLIQSYLIQFESDTVTNSILTHYASNGYVKYNVKHIFMIHKERKKIFICIFMQFRFNSHILPKVRTEPMLFSGIMVLTFPERCPRRHTLLFAVPVGKFKCSAHINL